MSNSHQPIDRLLQESRVRGAASVFPEGTPADAVTHEGAERVMAAVIDYINESGMSRSAIAKAIGIAASTLGTVLAWKYPGNWKQIVLDLDRWLEDQGKRDAAPRPSNFVWTTVAEEIRAVADAAATLQTIGLVFGPSGAGKTMALHAIAAEKPGSMIVTAEKMNATAGGVLRSIARQLRIGNGQCADLYYWIKTALAGTPRMLIVDRIHNLCDGRTDRALYTLADLHDATGAPQLWCGTTDVVAYLDRGQARGQEPLAQIRRRIGISRDLAERTVGGDGGPGEPLFTIEEIRKVFGRSQMRLAPDGARYLAQLANLPDSGCLGACRNLMVMAAKIHNATAPITADMLRAIHRLLASRRVFVRMDQEMSRETAPPAARKVPA